MKFLKAFWNMIKYVVLSIIKDDYGVNTDISLDSLEDKNNDRL